MWATWWTGPGMIFDPVPVVKSPHFCRWTMTRLLPGSAVVTNRFPRKEEDALRRVPGRRAPGLWRGSAVDGRGAGGRAYCGEQAPWTLGGWRTSFFLARNWERVIRSDRYWQRWCFLLGGEVLVLCHWGYLALVAAVAASHGSKPTTPKTGLEATDISLRYMATNAGKDSWRSSRDLRRFWRYQLVATSNDVCHGPCSTEQWQTLIENRRHLHLPYFSLPFKYPLVASIDTEDFFHIRCWAKWRRVAT